jgi:quercetin dioxygenase-like cupin family protein
MPVVGKVMGIAGTRDTAEILEMAATTRGAYVRTRIVFDPNIIKPAVHVHPYQDETYQIESGTLTYMLDGEVRRAEAGTTVVLPRNVVHQHYSEGPERTFTIQTITPALDFDYLIENIFGLASEGKLVRGRVHLLQGSVWLRKLKGPITLPNVPLWLQRIVATLVTPIAYAMGYRAVYQRFSGEEW